MENYRKVIAIFRIMKAWRNEVIENENTYQQKINNRVAYNHFTNKQKYKVLRGWKLSTRFNKAFPLLIKSIKVAISYFLQKYLISFKSQVLV